MATRQKNEQWSVGTFIDEGNPVFVRIRRQNHLFPEGFETLLAVCWDYHDDVVKNAMPSPDTAQLMDAVENNLSAAEQEGVAVLTAVVTGNGVREWQWYVSDPQSFLAVMNRVLPQDEPLPISVRAQSDPRHEAYMRWATQANLSN